MTRAGGRWLALATTLAACTWLAGCRSERVTAEPIAVSSAEEGAPPARPPQSTMTIAVEDVAADPTLDALAIRDALRDAETALLSCLDPGGSTGVLAVSFPIERSGAVGNIVEGARTTYGSEDARACMERILGVMRFPATHLDGRAEVRITLEVRELH